MTPKSAHVVSFNDVNRNNLVQMASHILDRVSQACFIAIDFEFSGLGEHHPKDMNHRYVAMKQTVEDHTIFSIGLSIVKKKEEEEKGHFYICDNFNFLTLKQGKFTIDSSTGEFLVKHKFSFDRLFVDGIPFLPPSSKQQQQPSTLVDVWKGIMQLMARRDIPLVIHHGLFDLMYLYHSFIGPLPKTLSGFLKEISNHFPSGIYDTKFLVEQGDDHQASFLGYVFAKYDRLRQNRFDDKSTEAKPYFEIDVQAPIQLEQTKKNKKTEEENDDDRPTKRQDVRKEPYCTQFAEHGYCKLGHDPHSKLHDIQIILDHQMGPSIYPQVYSSSLDKDEPKTDTRLEGAHASHFDAYMTGFTFCYLSHTMDPIELKNYKNKVKIRGMHVPLTFPLK
ncbi:ribonuclease CAF1 [Rhizopus microsporus ATCC 52813]|uniref:Ribonuclease CAF1 n=1 Tax=Rhizopus microsporus ATCC 52813 TaxID=1340429 RepID=A0A2G4SIA5_RHIZD|nr:ribonuclease CAF1 [Rhizopus microsporus ATCC 52813]PHZ08482.1 ribonuclease CAF1 [Rhizopus microsporus ATCC 52813]